MWLRKNVFLFHISLKKLIEKPNQDKKLKGQHTHIGPVVQSIVSLKVADRANIYITLFFGA